MKGSAIAPVLVGLADAVSSWSLPTWLDCVGSAVTSADESVTVYKVLSFALPGALDGLPGLASDISDKESGCLFWDLLRSRPDPLLFRLLRREPVLSLVLSDLGQLVTDFTTNTTDFSGDLTLEPWFQAHCESGVAVYTMRSEDCQNNDFRTAVLEQEHHWKTVASGLYVGLQPQIPAISAAQLASATHIAVVGSHSGLSLGVSNALLEALRGETQVRLVYFGHWAWCQNVDNCQEPQN